MKDLNLEKDKIYSIYAEVTCNEGYWSNPTETDLRVYTELKDSTEPIGVSQ
jgi:hypothetical protein